MEDSITDFLSNIENLNSKFEIIQISSGSKIECSLMTFKQQKKLLSSAIDGIVGIIKFQKILNDILLENTGVNLLVTDKIPIILKMRKMSIGDTIDTDDGVVSLDDLIKKSESMKFSNSNKITGVVDISLKIPTINEENDILNFAVSQMSNDFNDNAKNLNNLYTYEIIKFVECVKFGDKELLFNDLSINDRIRVIESLPLSINKKIIKYIEDIKKIENDSLGYDIDGVRGNIDIDVSFFDT